MTNQQLLPFNLRMVDVKTLSVGDHVVWLGGTAVPPYGQRRVPATVLVIKDEKRIKIEIKTDNGSITKWVSNNALLLANTGTGDC